MPELNWLGDRKAKAAAKKVPYRLLEPVTQAGDPSAGNLLIQGDSLDALKSLLPLYSGRVKCVFIDPPYKTIDCVLDWSWSVRSFRPSCCVQ